MQQQESTLVAGGKALMDASIDDIWSRDGQPGIHDHPSVGAS
jgi:hypothetical protein